MSDDDFTTKRCTKCGNELPATVEYFNAAKLGKYGLSAKCKACNHLYYEANKDKIKQRAKDWHEANLDKVGARYRATYVPHPHQNVTTPERVSDQKKRYREANRDKCNAATKRSKQNNPVGRTAEKQRRRAREKSLPVGFTQSDWRRCLDYFGNVCAVCNRPRGLWHTLAADHWIPLSKGGPTTPDNIVPLCHGIDGCNNTKAGNDPLAWLTSKFGPRRAKQIAKRIEDYFATLE